MAKKIGRPRVPESEVRKQRVSLSLTDKEYDGIKDASESEGYYAPAGFCRKVVLNHVRKNFLT